MDKNIHNLFIDEDLTISAAMQKITDAAAQHLPVGILCIVDAHGKLKGTVTDGDIRKALVKGVQLESPVGQIMTRNPITVSDRLSVDEMIDMVKEKVRESKRIRDYKVDQVIIVDHAMRVTDVVDFYELLHRQELKYNHICVIGTGHIGVTLQVVLAEAGFQVSGYDINTALVRQLEKGDLPFFESGLEPLLRFHLGEGHIQYITQIDDAPADAYIICVGTPVDINTKEPNLDSITSAVKTVGKVLKKDDMVILRSTVPVGTTRKYVVPLLEAKSNLAAGRDFHLVFAPERVVEGEALKETKSIPQIIGGINMKSVEVANRIFQRITGSIVSVDTLEEAEMVKLINNTFRDLSFAFANKIALLCGSLNLDSVKIIQAARKGYPRNPIPFPSPGVGGYCLTKDPYILADVAQKAGVDARLFHEARTTNESMIPFTVDKVRRFINAHYPSDKNLKLFFLGLAFKGYPHTSDMRESTSIDILNGIREVFKDRARCFGYDPVVKTEDMEKQGLTVVSYSEGFKDAHAVLILNNHPDFGVLDIFTLAGLMQRPALLFDGWYFFEPRKIRRLPHLIYEGLGGGYRS